MEKIPPIEELVDLSLLQRNLDSIAFTTGISFYVVHPNGKLIKNLGKQNIAFADSNFYSQYCFKATVDSIDRSQSQRKRNGVMLYDCSCGFSHLIVPLMLIGNPIVFLISERIKVPIVNLDAVSKAKHQLSVMKDTISELAEREHNRIRLHQIIRGLNEADNLVDVIDFVVDVVKELTGGEDASLLEWNSRTDTLIPIIHKGTDYHEVPPGIGITRRALGQGTQRVSNVKKDPDYLETEPRTKSELAVPLRSKGQVMGVLDVQSQQLGHFTEKHAKLLETLADHIGVALEKIRRVEEAESLRKVRDAISHGVEIEDVVQLILEQAADLTEASNAWLRVINKQTKKLVIQQVMDGNLDLFRDYDLDRNIIDQNIDIRQPYWCSDISQDPAYPGLFKEGSDLMVPIFAEGEVIGTLSVWSQHANAFNQDHLRRLKELAYPAGVAIERATFFKTLSDIALQIGKLDEADFLKYLTDEIQELFKPESHCTIWLYDMEGNYLFHKNVGIQGDPFVDCLPLPMTGISGDAIKNKKPIAVTDISKGERHHFKNIAQKAGFKSVLSIPITIGNRVLGVFNVHTFEKHTFTKLEINALSAFAGYAAVAIEISRMLEQLEAEGRAKSELIAVFAHELRTPLTKIQFHLNRWKKAEDIPQKYREQAASLYESSERQKRLINRVITFALMKRGEVLRGTKKELVLNDLLRSIVEMYQRIAEDEAISLQYKEQPENLVFHADRDMMNHIFDNLLDNAMRYTPEGGTIRIGVSDDPETIKIAVSDTGVGIPEKFQQRIFEDFYSGDASKGLKGGMGIGLYLVKQIIEDHDGTIHVTSKPGEGSTFTVILPKGKPNEHETDSHSAD